MSRRQEIVDILMLRLKAISIVNGYANDLVTVDEWRASKVNEKEMPALILRDTSSSVGNRASGSSDHTVQIEIDVLVSDKSTTMAKLRTILADVLKAVGAESDDLPEHRTYEGDEILAEHQDHLYGGARMKFTVVYDTPSWEI